MQTYEIYVKGRTIYANSADMALVRTSVGIDQVHFLFDHDEWLGFPVSVTFSQGGDFVTQVMQLSEVVDSEWVAEGTVTIPSEVIDMVGPIQVALHGTDANGNHIITAKGYPLYVEEAGDIEGGIVPSDKVTPSELEQAYALAMEAVNQAASLVANLQSRIDSVVNDAIDAIEHAYGGGYGPATELELGLVKVGSGLTVESDGTLSAMSGKLTADQISTINRLVAVIDSIADYTYDRGYVTSSEIRPEKLPVATNESLGTVYPDGITTIVGSDGMLHALPAATDVPNATVASVGVVKPDGLSVTVDDDGTIGVVGIPVETIDELTPFERILPYIDDEGY